MTEVSSQINRALVHEGRRADTKVLGRLERYAEELDIQVYGRFLLLMDETRKSDSLLREIFPAKIVENMKKGRATDPEAFDSVTIMFGEINDISDLVTAGNPTSLLHQLDKMGAEVIFSPFTVSSLSFCKGFDGILTKFRVYKVETIKDTYLVVSGLPERNGDSHAREICGLSLASMKTFQFCEVASQTSLRVGVNSGLCVAGVVG